MGERNCNSVGYGMACLDRSAADHSFVRSFVSFLCLFIPSFVHSFFGSFFLSFPLFSSTQPSFVSPFIGFQSFCFFIRSFLPSLTHLFITSFIRSFVHSFFVHSFVHVVDSFILQECFPISLNDHNVALFRCIYF